MKSIKEMTEALKANKERILKDQAAYEASLPEVERNRVCRNRNTHGGWIVPGIAAYTQAVKKADMPWDRFWSGSNPTPSTQYPQAVYNFLNDFNKEVEQWTN